MGSQGVRHHLVTDHTHTRHFYGAKPNRVNMRAALRFQIRNRCPLVAS